MIVEWELEDDVCLMPGVVLASIGGKKFGFFEIGGPFDSLTTLDFYRLSLKRVGEPSIDVIDLGRPVVFHELDDERLECHSLTAASHLRVNDLVELRCRRRAVSCRRYGIVTISRLARIGTFIGVRFLGEQEAWGKVAIAHHEAESHRLREILGGALQ